MKVYTSRCRTNGPAVIRGILICLIESPSKKEGKSLTSRKSQKFMEVHLNESPSEKEGKFTEQRGLFLAVTKPSMKVPPKRKGNADACDD